MHKLIVANYKMNGNKSFYVAAQKKLKSLNTKDTKIVLCPPFVYLPFFKIKNNNIELGVQDISEKVNNKSTGQISPEMLNEFNAKYVIIGHSERRSLGETDEQIANKVKNAFDNNIQPIICVGEKDKNSGLEVLEKQVFSALEFVRDVKPIFAYEPVWAIGSGEVPKVAQINKAITIIKKAAKRLGFEASVLYGGSVNLTNYLELNKSKAKGFLLGGISLKVDEFIALVKGVENE